jgi:predicted nucleic acid-binding protein
MTKVEAAIQSGVFHRLKIVAVAELESMAEYAEQFGKGESACLAVAIHRHRVVATDETKDRGSAEKLPQGGSNLLSRQVSC